MVDDIEKFRLLSCMLFWIFGQVGLVLEMCLLEFEIQNYELVEKRTDGFISQ